VVGGNNLFEVAGNNRGDDHDHDVPNHDHGVPNRRHQHERQTNTGLQELLIELKKVIFSWDDASLSYSDWS
jgi:hypothetical protein